MSKRLRPQSLSYDDIKNSPERHTSYQTGKQLLANLMNAGDVGVAYAKLSLKCTVCLDLCYLARDQGWDRA